MEINIVKLKKYASACSVLYVEDDELIRTQTADFLGRFFPDVVLAEDGEIGLSKYNSRKFDVVITDINMPNMNGIDMIKEIKEIDYNQRVIVTSAYNDSEYLMNLINLDVTKFVLKPFNNKQFLYILYKIAEDITSKEEHKKLQNEIAALSKRAQIIVDHVKIGIVIFKDNEIDMANKAFLDIGGYASFEELKLEVPEIGVLFEEASRCINAPTNAELIEQLKLSNEDEKKVRIAKNTTIYEYKVGLTKLEEENSYVLTFSDITAIHNALYQDEHTKLPMRKFILEEIDVLKHSTNILNIIIIHVKNFKNIVKWYGKPEAISVEKEFANAIKEIKKNNMPDAFIGYFGENQIVIISDKEDIENHIDELSGINLFDLKLFNNHEQSDINFHLITQAKFLQLDTNKELSDLEVDLINEFDLM